MNARTLLTMRSLSVIAILMIGGGWQIAMGQTTRPLTMKLDTLEQNVCGPKTFTMPLWIGDIPVSDSLYAVTVILAWDVATLDLEDFVLTGANTLTGGLSRQPLVVRDRTQGILYVELGTDPNAAPIAGADKPLLFLRGTITAPDTIDGQRGWIDITNASFTANVQYEPFERRPGIVRVRRDTTPSFTGRMSVARGEFDTLRFDTVDVQLDNIGGRRVRSLSFAIAADTAHYVFVDTMTTGTLAGTLSWVTREVSLQPDTLRGRFEASGDLVGSGVLLRLVIERRTRTAFTGRMEVTEFSVNEGSCLGRLVREGADVSARTIPPTGSSVAAGPDLARSPQVTFEGSVVQIEGWSGGEEGVAVYTAIGGRIQLQSVVRTGPATLMVSAARELPSGRYVVVLRDRNGYVNKQFTVIR